MKFQLKIFFTLVSFLNSLLFAMDPPPGHFKKLATREQLSQTLIAELLEENQLVLSQAHDSSVLIARPGESADDKSFRMFWTLFVDRNNVAKKELDADCLKIAYGLLELAISHNDARMLRLVLAIPCINVNHPCVCQSRHLFNAAEEGKAEMAELLLRVPDIEVNFTLERRLGESPLHIATSNGHTRVVELLLNAQGILVNPRNPWGQTPLHRAAENGHREVIRLLRTRNGVDVNLPTHQLETPLHTAAAHSHTESVRELLESPDINVNAETPPIKLKYDITLGSSTPFDYCKDLATALLLIEAGVAITAKSITRKADIKNLFREYLQRGVHRTVLTDYNLAELLQDDQLVLLLSTGTSNDVAGFIAGIPAHRLPEMFVYASALGQVGIFNALLSHMGMTLTKEVLIRAFSSAIRGGHVPVVTSLMAVLAQEDRLLETIIEQRRLKLLIARLLSSARINDQQRADYGQIRDLLSGSHSERAEAPPAAVIAEEPALPPVVPAVESARAPFTGYCTIS